MGFVLVQHFLAFFHQIKDRTDKIYMPDPLPRVCPSAPIREAVGAVHFPAGWLWLRPFLPLGKGCWNAMG